MGASTVSPQIPSYGLSSMLGLAGTNYSVGTAAQQTFGKRAGVFSGCSMFPPPVVHPEILALWRAGPLPHLLIGICAG